MEPEKFEVIEKIGMDYLPDSGDTYRQLTSKQVMALLESSIKSKEYPTTMCVPTTAFLPMHTYIDPIQILCRKEINYIRMSQKEREQLHAEFSILSSLRHPNIVAYYHREHLKSTQDLHIYMEYCGGGDLSKVIKNLIAKNQYAEEEFVWSIFAQLVTALYRCHYGVDPPDVGKNIMGPGVVKPTGLRLKNQVMILHRDLKPENGG